MADLSLASSAFSFLLAGTLETFFLDIHCRLLLLEYFQFVPIVLGYPFSLCVLRASRHFFLHSLSLSIFGLGLEVLAVIGSLLTGDRGPFVTCVCTLVSASGHIVCVTLIRRVTNVGQWPIRLSASDASATPASDQLATSHTPHRHTSLLDLCLVSSACAM